MINITVIKQGEFILTIEASGHSGYAEEGSDIICSAVSTLTQNCEKGLKEMLGIKTIFSRNVNKAYLSISLPNDISEQLMHDAQVLLRSTYLGLKDLADSYPKFINIKEKRK